MDSPWIGRLLVEQDERVVMGRSSWFTHLHLPQNFLVPVLNSVLHCLHRGLWRDGRYTQVRLESG